MKLSINFPLRILFVIFLFVLVATSCKKEVDTRVKLPVEKVTATAPNIDLSGRTDWVIGIGNVGYAATIANSIITAVPASEPYLAEYLEADSKKAYEYGVLFFSPGYFRNITSIPRNIMATSPVTPPPPNVEDQSTLDKLVKADLLYGSVSIPPTKNLSNIVFVHGNSLIDFETSGFPVGSVVKVKHAVETIPFNYKQNFYKAIIAYYHPEIIVENGSEKYKIMPLTNQNGVFSNNIYKFRLVFNTLTKTITTENVTATKWSELADW